MSRPSIIDVEKYYIYLKGKTSSGIPELEDVRQVKQAVGWVLGLVTDPPFVKAEEFRVEAKLKKGKDTNV